MLRSAKHIAASTLQGHLTFSFGLGWLSIHMPMGRLLLVLLRNLELCISIHAEVEAGLDGHAIHWLL